MVMVPHSNVVQQYYRIGGTGGSEYNCNRIKARAVVKKIETWLMNEGIKAIKITFTDGHQVVIGHIQGTKYPENFEIDFGAGDKITDLRIWGNGAGSRVGAFKIKYTKGGEEKTYHPIMLKWPIKGDGYPQQIGSGIMLGAFGYSGADVDSMGFCMLRKIDHVFMTSVKYDQSGQHLLPPMKKSDLEVTIPNPTKETSQQGYQDITKQNVESGKWTVTTGLKLGAEYKVKGKVPFVAEGETTAKWEFGVEHEYSRQWSTSESTTVRLPFNCPALSMTEFRTACFEGNANDVPFEAQMEYTLDNGAKWYTTVKGLYEGTSHTKWTEEAIVVKKYDPEHNKWIDVDAAHQTPLKQVVG